MRRAIVLLAIWCLFIDCKKKAPSFDEQLAVALQKNGITLPAASSATVPAPQEGIMVLIHREWVDAESVPGFATSSSPYRIFSVDPARAATEGVDAKYKRTPAEHYIVPLASVATMSTTGGAKKATLAASEAAPPQRLYAEIRSTLAAIGVTEQYRLVRSSDGKVVAERLPPL